MATRREVARPSPTGSSTGAPPSSEGAAPPPDDRELYESLFEQHPDGVVLTVDGRIVLVNSSFEELSGYSRSEAAGRALAEFVTPEQRERAEKSRHGLLNEGPKVPSPYLLLHRAGGSIPIDVRSNPVEFGGKPSILSIVRDLSERQGVEGALRLRGRQQAAVAGLGLRALKAVPLEMLMADAVASLTDVLNVEYAKVLELPPGGGEFLLRAGVGWKPGLVGTATVTAAMGSQAGFTLSSERPVVVEDFTRETRFAVPPLLTEHEVRSGISVVIYANDQPYGVLGAHSTKVSTFSSDDVDFLQAVANILGEAIERNTAEVALRESEERYRALAEASFEGIAMHDQGQILEANDQFASLFGYERSEVVGMSVFDLVQPASLEEVQQRIASQDERPYEVLGLRRDGSTVDVEVHAKQITVGGLTRRVAAVRDMTERRQAEAALRESEERYRTIAESMSEGLGMQDLDGRITFANRGLCEMLGYSFEEMRGRRVQEFLAPGSVATYKKAVSDSVDGQAEAVELELITKSGASIWTTVSGKPVFDDAGTRTGGFALLTDITERRAAATSLYKSERRFYTAFHANPITAGIVELPEGTVIDANDAAIELIGYSRDETIGRTVQSLELIVEPDALQEMTAAFQKAGIIENFEVQLCTKTGEIKDIVATAKLIDIEDRRCVLAMVVDITDRLRLEAELEAAREELEGRVERKLVRGNPYKLTFREFTVLHLVADGKADKEIAAELGISPLTVHRHVSNILGKMTSRSRTEAVTRAIREGLLD